MTEYVLGVDIGTSKVAVVVNSPVEQEAKFFQCHSLAETQIQTKQGYSEQNTEQIFNATVQAINAIPEQIRSQIAALGVTGQMHGVVLWNPGTTQYTSLVNWQDSRCSVDGVLAELQHVTGDTGMRDGFGASTLGWYAARKSHLLHDYSAASTIQGCFVSECIGSATGLIDSSDAASWGLFDSQSKEWKKDRFTAIGVDTRILPEVLAVGAIAGSLQLEWAAKLDLPVGIPVMISVGDNQASLFSTIGDPETDIALTLGTGGQLSVVLSAYPAGELPETVEIRPYVDDQYIAVAAALCGGAAFRWLVELLEDWLEELELPVPDRDTLYSKLDTLALQGDPEALSVCSSFLGERHAPDRKGIISKIDMHSCSLRNLSAALSDSLVKNLRDMLSDDLLAGRTKVLGSGNAIRQLHSVQQAVERTFGLPLITVETQEEAATGAALLAARSLLKAD